MKPIPSITLNTHQQKQLLQSTSSKKYQVIILLMLDCGLCVSEVIQLQSKHILFAKNKIETVSKTKSRAIPLNQLLHKYYRRQRFIKYLELAQSVIP